MIAQIYTASNDDNTSILVCNDKGNIYFTDILDVPEITGIQRGVSFVKHNIDFDKTEIYPDKLDSEYIMKDAYINYCKVKHSIGTRPIESAVQQCKQNLAIYNRWKMKGNNNGR